MPVMCPISTHCYKAVTIIINFLGQDSNLQNGCRGQSDHKELDPVNGAEDSTPVS